MCVCDANSFVLLFDLKPVNSLVLNIFVFFIVVSQRRVVGGSRYYFCVVLQVNNA